jgi:hypothetical protein
MKVQRKKTLTKKRTLTKNKKSSDIKGYNEGAEENKNWLAESQTTFSNELSLNNDLQ